jgi:hypothetical protein
MAAEQLKKLGLRTDFTIEESPKIPITKSQAPNPSQWPISIVKFLGIGDWWIFG